MTSPLRRATIAIMAVVALTLAGCGVSGSDASSDATVPSAPATVTTPDGPATTEAPSDTTAADPSAPDSSPATTEPSTPGSLPGGVDEKSLRDSFIQGFEAAGLTKEQATCLANAYIDKVGVGTGATPDYSQILDLFGQCTIDPADLGGGTPGG